MADDFDSFDESGVGDLPTDALEESPAKERNLGQIETVPPGERVGVPLIFVVNDSFDVYIRNARDPSTEVIYLDLGYPDRLPLPRLRDPRFADDLAVLRATLDASNIAAWDRRGWVKPNWLFIFLVIRAFPFSVSSFVADGDFTHHWGTDIGLTSSDVLIGRHRAFLFNFMASQEFPAGPDPFLDFGGFYARGEVDPIAIGSSVSGGRMGFTLQQLSINPVQQGVQKHIFLFVAGAFPMGLAKADSSSVTEPLEQPDPRFPFHTIFFLSPAEAVWTDVHYLPTVPFSLSFGVPFNIGFGQGVLQADPSARTFVTTVGAIDQGWRWPARAAQEIRRQIPT